MIPLMLSKRVRTFQCVVAAFGACAWGCGGESGSPVAADASVCDGASCSADAGQGTANVECSDPLCSRGTAEVCERWNARVARPSGTSWWTAGAAACDLGTIVDGSKQDALKRINTYRWLAGLADNVVENTSQFQDAQSCAVMMAVNGAIDHTPPNSWACRTPEALAGAGSSNLSAGADLGGSIDNFMRDSGNETTLGHRRWFLNPPLGKVGLGYAENSSGVGYSCVGVFDQSGSAGRSWVAYPNPGPAPLPLAQSMWSFSATGLDPDNVDVEVYHKADNKSLGIEVTKLADGFGQPAVGWRPKGWDVVPGVVYRVVVTQRGQSPIEYEVLPVSC
jgi:uncharacterized protein YkwD